MFMAPAEIHVEVAYCPAPGQIDLVALTLPAGATLADALDASGLRLRHALPVEGLRLGLWGKLREPSQVLRECDRVEVYRPLRVDPKEARRQRYQRHRERFPGR
jgi:putative ubiquitin-RnfH superfamily antitoxin RatB of RatAB toxin-antitoxin module